MIDSSVLQNTGRKRLWLQLAAVILPIALFAAGGVAMLQYRLAQASHIPATFVITQSPAANANGWNNTPVTVNACFTSEDSEIVYIASLAILGQQINTPNEGGSDGDTDCTDFYYDFEVDSDEYFWAGFSDSCCSFEAQHPVRIDMTKPVLTVIYAKYGSFSSLDTASATVPAASNYTPGTWSNKKIAVFLSCADVPGGSDVMSGIDVNTYPERINFGEGIHAFNPAGVCKDKAGNIADEPVGAMIMVDTVAPVCDVVQPAHADKTGLFKPITLNISATDATSGIASKTITGIVKGGLGAGGSFAGPAVPGAAGQIWSFSGAPGVQWKVTGMAADVAGNTSNCTFKTILSK